MNRDQVIEEVVEAANVGDAVIVAGNGLTARVLYSLGERERNFYMLGSMGLAASIGLGIALSRPGQLVIAVEGDGNLLMGLGSLSLIGHLRPENLCHVVLDNNVYETTGGQPTVSSTVAFDKVALATGYSSSVKIADRQQLASCLSNFITSAVPGPTLLWTIVELGGSRPSRVPLHPWEIATRFRASLAD